MSVIRMFRIRMFRIKNVWNIVCIKEMFIILEIPCFYQNIQNPQ